MTDALLTTTLLWSMGLGLYHLLLRPVPAHGFKRAYLLALAICGALAPWLPRPEAVSPLPLPTLPSTSAVWLDEVTVGAEATASSWPTPGDAIAVVYCFGFVIEAVMLLRGIRQLVACFRESRPVPGAAAGGMAVREGSGTEHAFSFGRTLFVRDWHALDAESRCGLVAHERAHWRLGHRYDNALLAGLCTVAWFHPLAYFLRRELRLVHEYQADAAALRRTTAAPYRRLLLSARLQTSPLHLATALGHEPLKARFDMMTKRFSPKQTWRLATAAFLVAAATVACTKEDVDAELLDELTAAQSEEIVGGSRTFDLRAGAAEGSTLRIDTVVTFDPETLEEATELVFTVVDPGGDEVETYKSGPHSPEDMARRRAEREGEEDVRIGAEQLIRGQPVYRIVEDMPHFNGAGCAEGDRRCYEKSLLEFVYSNVRYPAADRDAGVEGKVIASFVVGTDGAILEPEIVRGPSETLNAEVLRLLGEMPEWTPGRQDGRLVQTRFVLPVQFKLD